MAYDLIREILIHSYLYYERSENIIPDSEFDALCREAYDTWDTLESPWKHLTTKCAMEAGTGPDFGYPEDIMAWARERLADYEELKEALG